jgi:aminopeptidase N
MRTEQPQVIYLKDYQAPEYLIDETHLTFELFEDHTLVHAQLVMRRNPRVAGPAATGARRPAAGTAARDAG